MRTTLTLDDDVAALLSRARKARKVGLKQIVNEALRQGLKELLAGSRPSKPYRTQPADLGRCLLGNVDNIAEVVSLAEGKYRK